MAKQISGHKYSFFVLSGEWGPTNWPPEELIRSDIRQDNSYVCLNDSGEIVGTFFFTQGPDIEPTYREITDGEWLDGSPYGVVHRIASDGSEKGTGSFCINWAFDQCGHLRIDTHGDNAIMQNLLLKSGFRPLLRCFSMKKVDIVSLTEYNRNVVLRKEKNHGCIKMDKQVQR